jgi:hypothetical protein
MFMVPLLAACASSGSEGTADTSPDPDAESADTSPDPDAEIADPGTGPDAESADTSPDAEVREPCWPNHNEAACEAAGWTWHSDYATHFCPDPEEYCPPPEYSYFCALPCEQDTDCRGTTAPYCGRIGYWGGSDNYGCSSFKVCVPLEPTYEWGCYDPRPTELCSR